MNSYPPELLVQLAPVMFVAGLGPQPAAAAAAPQSPAPRTQDPFALLATRLKDALLAQRKPAVWAPDKSKTFQVVLVDPDVRFPPRKTPPSDDHQFLPTHSPLSPLTASSPLYPDGLIAPIWIRKHTTFVPSVFVLFKRIYETPRPAANTPLDASDPEREREKEAEERARDSELAADIAQRKRSTNERAIKLTVVLMASRRMLDDPSLDTRLTFIRRQSGLDPRAALFVLSPVTQAEIGDFVRSLQEALYEPAIEYYTNHSKRVRRKRNRHSQANSYAIPVSPTAVAPRPLRPEGWTVRYEYKMACFAEFRGEDEVALKHYQDAYSTLHIMFGSTAILPPRTKRWAEAKVLADCISVKICKLYLYNNEHSLALAHHSSHMRRFADLSRGWGIGEETFEFWSWLARQHRIFAELLEQGSRASLTIPTHLPATKSTTSLNSQPGSDPTPTASQRGAPTLEADSMRVLGLNPTQALQHPGFYYYTAAQCTENRRARYLEAVENSSMDPASSPGYANESKVDHLSIILELYTRSYELFKKYSPPASSSQGRQTLWIAYRIAQTYHQSGKFEMAVRFFERIAKTYRREKWDAMLLPLLETWYACAQQLGDVELSVQLLLEMLAHGAAVDRDEPDALQEDLIAVMKSTVPSAQDRPMVVDLSESEPLLDTSALFWFPEVKVGERALFQLTVAAPPDAHLSLLPFQSLAISFGEGEDAREVVVYHNTREPPETDEEEDREEEGEAEEEIPAVQRVDLGHIAFPALEDDAAHEVFANLRWVPGSAIVLTGSIASEVPGTLSISKLVLTLREGSWWVELPMPPTSTRGGCASAPRWLAPQDPPKFVPLPLHRDVVSSSSVVVRHRQHAVQVSLTHNSPAYLDEEYPVTIEVTNADDRTLEVVADILLQPSEIEGAVHSISSDHDDWSNLLKGISFGSLLPGVSALKTLYLRTSGASGDRIIDISVQSRNINASTTPSTPSPPPSPKSPNANAGDTGETLRTLVVPTVAPITCTSRVTYSRSRQEGKGLADLETFDDEGWAGSVKMEASVVMGWRCLGPHVVKVEDVKLVKDEDGRHTTIVDSMLEAEPDEFLTEWYPGDEFSDQCLVTIHNEATPDGTVPSPGTYEIKWRRELPDGSFGSLTTSTFPLPILTPPTDGLIALLDVPTVATLHVPIPLRLTIRNGRPTRSANITVHVEFDAADGFVLAGLRSGRLPVLLPGAEEEMRWNIVPVECGLVRVPRVRVVDRRVNVGGAEVQGQSEEGEEVVVVDLRRDARAGAEEGAKADAPAAGAGDVARKVVERKPPPPVDITVLVLP